MKLNDCQSRKTRSIDGKDFVLFNLDMWEFKTQYKEITEKKEEIK